MNDPTFRFHAWTEENEQKLTDREQLIFHVSNYIVDKYVWSLPVNIKNIYNILNIKIVPLSEYLTLGMTREEVYAVWGNTDGAASKMGSEYAVGFNDVKVSEKRARFTLAEELSHILLGHTDDPLFNAFRTGAQPDVYDRYEAEAKATASLILIPGAFWLRHKGAGIHRMAKVCGVSEACAYTSGKWYEDHEDLIRIAATHKLLEYNLNSLRDNRKGIFVEKSSRI